MAAKKKTKKKTVKRSTAKRAPKTQKPALEDLQNFTTGKLDDSAIEKVKKLEEVLGLKRSIRLGRTILIFLRKS